VGNGSDRCVPRYDTAHHPSAHPARQVCIIRARSRQVSPRPTGPSWQRARVWRQIRNKTLGNNTHPLELRSGMVRLNACHACQRSTRWTPHRLAPCLPGGERWMSSRVKPPPEFPLFDRLCPCGEEETKKASLFTVPSCDLQASARYRVNMPSFRCCAWDLPPVAVCTIWRPSHPIDRTVTVCEW
jgi:hypothetical protein